MGSLDDNLVFWMIILASVSDVEVHIFAYMGGITNERDQVFKKAQAEIWQTNYRDNKALRETAPFTESHNTWLIMSSKISV